MYKIFEIKILYKINFILIFCNIRYDFVIHANKGKDSRCKGKCGDRDQLNINVLSEGVFRIRVTGYMVCNVYKVHQEALLIYNKRVGDKDELEIDRRASASQLTTLSPKSVEHKSFHADRVNSKLMPMLNALNYAPLWGTRNARHYHEKNFISLNELESCATKDCKPHSGDLMLY